MKKNVNYLLIILASILLQFCYEQKNPVILVPTFEHYYKADLEFSLPNAIIYNILDEQGLDYNNQKNWRDTSVFSSKFIFTNIIVNQDQIQDTSLIGDTIKIYKYYISYFGEDWRFFAIKNDSSNTFETVYFSYYLSNPIVNNGNIIGGNTTEYSLSAINIPFTRTLDGNIKVNISLNENILIKINYKYSTNWYFNHQSSRTEKNLEKIISFDSNSKLYITLYK
jgi:hypothetical protein